MRDRKSGTAEKTRNTKNWVVFFVRKEVVGSISSCTPISSRLISIRILERPHNITVIEAYAPASKHEDKEVEQSYEQLDSILAKTPKKDIHVDQGELSTTAGPDA